MPATKNECFTDCIGKKVIGVLFGVNGPPGRSTIVFDDGSGLTFDRVTGSVWLELPPHIKATIQRRLEALIATQGEIATVLGVAQTLGIRA